MGETGRQRQQAGILYRRSVSYPSQVFTVRCESDKRLQGFLPRQHHQIPALVLRADIEIAARAQKQSLPAAADSALDSG